MTPGSSGRLSEAALPLRDIIPIKPTVSTSSAPAPDLAPVSGMDVVTIGVVGLLIAAVVALIIVRNRKRG